MLARSRFETETPNVIDAGDSAPSRPSRRSDPSDRGVASETGTTGRISFPEDSRQYTASNKGHIAKGVRINYSIEADEEPDACSPFDDDHTNEVTTATPSHVSLSTAASHHDELQIRGTAAARIHHKSFSQRSSFNARDNARSIQEARLFAAHMLNESERRSNLHSEHTLSMKQESSSTLRHLMQKATGHSSRRFYDEISLVEEPTEIDMLRPRDSTTRLRKTTVCRMLAALVAIVVVVCFVVLATDAVVVQSDKGSSTLLSENGRLDSIVAFLFEQEVSSAKDLYDESTPQYRAARWMALEDPERLSVPEPVGGSMDGGGGLRNTNPLRFVQRYVLAVLFFGLDGENWENRRKFVTGVHECSWFESHVNRDGETYAMGVTCDHNMQVRNLLLPSNGLGGTIPPEIRHLPKLDFLDLQQNALTGTLPTELKALTLLNFLDLNNNQITGIIPHWLGDSLSRLQALGLSDNLLIGSIPGSLATGLAANLKTLSLDGNMLTGDIATLQRLRYLEFLYLNDNDFEGRLDHGLLADMPYLMEVDLSNNRISKGVPDYLFQMNSLKVLDVSHNFLTGGLPFDVGSGRRGTSPLEFVSLRNNSLAESIPASLMTHLGALTHFDLSFNLFTGDCPQAIGDMTGLSYLFLGDNNLVVTDGTIPGHLQSLTNLRELSLGNLDLQGPIPTWLEGFENLRLLDLSQNQLTGSLDLDFTQLSQLLVLLLHDNRLTGNLPPSLASLQDLTVLSLHHNEFLDESNTAGMVCDGSAGLELMTVDCGAVNCPCCGDCCDSDTCYEGVVWETLEYGDGQWEENFERSDYSFNPRITLAGPIFEAGCGKNCG